MRKVEAGEVPVQDAFGAGCLVSDGPTGQPVRAIPQQHAFGGVEQLLPRVVKAAQVLRPDGHLAIFGHVFEPPVEVAEPFAAAYRRVAPDSPFSNQPARRPLDMYQAGYAKVADKIRETEQFNDPEQWRFDWEQSYTRDQWLDLLPTTGSLTRLRPDQLAEILGAVGRAIDALGGRFTMHYTTLATTAVRAGTP